MKKLSLISKIVYILNIILVIVSLLGYLLPYFAPKVFPILSIFTLFFPALIVLNLIFILYWVLRLRKQILISILTLALGYTFISGFYQFFGKNEEVSPNDFTIMSYNVRLFNLFGWIKNEKIPYDIQEFIKEKSPDILCIQEYSKYANVDFSQYRYKHIYMSGNKIKTGNAIFSKYRIINQGEIILPASNNNVVYADIVKNQDTIRIYSIHLQSISISPDINELENLDENKYKKIIARLSEAFGKQQTQSELIQSHLADFKGKMIICGDMNNSAFSYVYKNIKGNLKDAFIEAGKGFGATYNYKYYPARIDYIFVDTSFKVKEFNTYSDFKNSDHYPIMTRIE